jgi:hypothetical protein
MFKLNDRIKEKTYSVGSGNLVLSGNTPSYSSFSSVYSSGDTFFYCVIDNSNYEIGLGKYIPNYIQRLEIIKSSDISNSIITWGGGLKEVYVTYPAERSVITRKNPITNSVAFFYDDNTIESISGVYYQGNKINSSIEFLFSNFISFSGYTVTQSAPFRIDELINSTKINELIFQSGEVNEFKGLNLQKAGTVFAGPVDNCVSGECPSGYPVFRPIIESDLPPINASKVNFTPSIPGNWDLIPTTIEEGLNYLSEFIIPESGINPSGEFVLNSSTLTNLNGYIKGNGTTVYATQIIDGGIF